MVDDDDFNAGFGDEKATSRAGLEPATLRAMLELILRDDIFPHSGHACPDSGSVVGPIEARRLGGHLFAGTSVATGPCFDLSIYKAPPHCLGYSSSLVSPVS